MLEFEFMRRTLMAGMMFAIALPLIGIVALFLGFGGPLGIAAALLHCVTHGLTKSFLFCLSGNVLMKCSSAAAMPSGPPKPRNRATMPMFSTEW